MRFRHLSAVAMSFWTSLCLILSSIVVAWPALAQRSPGPGGASWYATTRRLDSLHVSPVLRAEPLHLRLVNGWQCLVVPGTITDSRTTICRRGDDSVAFSVACDTMRNRDHVQLQFNVGGNSDYIEVGCKRPQVPTEIAGTYVLYWRSPGANASTVRIATFDARGGATNNRENCELTRERFQEPSRAGTRFWCARDTDRP
jgi:hypothetical protein